MTLKSSVTAGLLAFVAISLFVAVAEMAGWAMEGQNEFLHVVQALFIQAGNCVGCVLLSDNESWVTQGQAFAPGARGSTCVMTEWQTFGANQQRLGVQSPKLVCINIQHYGATQAPERDDILSIGGFSDAVFEVIAAHLIGDSGRFVGEVEAVER